MRAESGRLEKECLRWDMDLHGFKQELALNNKQRFVAGLNLEQCLRYGGRIQLLLKRLPDSSVSSLIQAG